MGKDTNFKFCTHFDTIVCNKSLLTILGKVAVGVARDIQIFRASIYRVHRAVFFAIARLSCLNEAMADLGRSTCPVVERNPSIIIFKAAPLS